MMGDVGKLIGAPTLKIVFVVLLLYLGLLENILLASFTGIRDSTHCKMPFGYMIYTANSHEFRLSSTQWLALNSRHRGVVVHTIILATVARPSSVGAMQAM